MLSPWLGSAHAIWSTETARVHHAARRRGGVAASGIAYCCGAGCRHPGAGAFLVSASLLRQHGLLPGRLRSVGSTYAPPPSIATTRSTTVAKTCVRPAADIRQAYMSHMSRRDGLRGWACVWHRSRMETLQGATAGQIEDFVGLSGAAFARCLIS